MPFCAYCGTEVPAGVRACPECGHPQAAAAAGGGLPMPPMTLPGGYVPTKQNESLATASLVMGILGLVICPIIGSILGIAFGLVAQRRIANDPSKGGKGLATGGIVTGALGIIVIPVIVALMVPFFLRARGTVEDTIAEVSLNTALQTTVKIANDARSYRAVNDTSLAASGSGLSWVANGESGGPTIVSYMVVDETEIRLAVLSTSGKCFGARDDAGGAGVGFASHEPGRQCNAGAFTTEEFARTSPSTDV